MKTSSRNQLNKKLSKTPSGCDSFSFSKKDNHEVVSEGIPKSPIISNDIDTLDSTSTEAVIEKEDQLNHLRRKILKHQAQFVMMMRNELLEVKNKIERLISEDSNNCCTNLRDEIKYLKEEILSKNLIIKILAENLYNSGNNKSNNCPCRCGNFQNVQVFR